MSKPYAILFVCMGNICRSPTAEGVLRHKVRGAGLEGRILVASAGTHDYHPGEPPDERSQRHARKRGYDLSAQRARQVRAADYRNCDLILAMDWDNLAMLQADCPPEHAHKLHRLMEFAGMEGVEVVPDPYYGGAAGFETVLDHVEKACDGLISYVRNRLDSVC